MALDKTTLAKIHIAKKELALSDQAYRDILFFNFQTGSAKDLTSLQARQLIELFRAKGWQPKPGRGQQKGKSRFITVKPGPAAKQQKKVLALWNALGYEMGALHGRVKKQFGVDRFEWLEDGQALHVLITDLQRRVTRQNKVHC
nr:regulatory protein GemA [uncultured Desulfobulbus sp.]